MILREGEVQPFCRSSLLIAFIATTVIPACRINVAIVPARMASLCAKFAALISAKHVDDQQMAQLKVASAALHGTFDSHPLILGLSLQCKRMCDKIKRGVESMVGRRSQESSHECQLISDAGIQLAAASGNSHLAREFGLSAAALRTKLDDLKLYNLPVPCLSVLWPEELRQNFVLANTRFPMFQGQTKRCLHAILQYVQ